MTTNADDKNIYENGGACVIEDSMPDYRINIERLKETVLPAIFRDPAAIGKYGENRSEKENLQELSDFMESGTVSALAIKIGEIVTKLMDADPQRMTQKTTWYDRLIGRDVERQVRYQVAHKALDELLGEAEGVAQGVRDSLCALDEILANHAIEAERLRMHIQAGREFLDENPQAGMVDAGSLEFDRPRERFARKLANLATLLSSHEMSVAQMNLTRAHAVDMLDRFHETSSVLVPVWRQHTWALLTTQNMSPVMVEAATKAHEALKRSLSKNLESIH